MPNVLGDRPEIGFTRRILTRHKGRARRKMHTQLLGFLATSLADHIDVDGIVVAMVSLAIDATRRGLGVEKSHGVFRLRLALE